MALPLKKRVESKDTCNTSQNKRQDTNKLIRFKFLKLIGFRLVVILLFIQKRKRQVRFLTVYPLLAKSVKDCSSHFKDKPCFQNGFISLSNKTLHHQINIKV